MNQFNIRRSGLRTLSEVCPTLGGRTRLNEIAPVLAAIGRGVAKVGQHVGAGALGAAKGVGMGLGVGALGAGKALAQVPGSVAGAIQNRVAGNVGSSPASEGPPSPPDAPTFSWTR